VLEVRVDYVRPDLHDRTTEARVSVQNSDFRIPRKVSDSLSFPRGNYDFMFGKKCVQYNFSIQVIHRSRIVLGYTILLQIVYCMSKHFHSMIR
jgi:hypothetical protein